MDIRSLFDKLATKNRMMGNNIAVENPARSGGEMEDTKLIEHHVEEKDVSGGVICANENEHSVINTFGKPVTTQSEELPHDESENTVDDQLTR